jgi:hypothetical protein
MQFGKHRQFVDAFSLGDIEKDRDVKLRQGVKYLDETTAAR